MSCWRRGPRARTTSNLSSPSSCWRPYLPSDGLVHNGQSVTVTAGTVLRPVAAVTVIVLLVAAGLWWGLRRGGDVTEAELLAEVKTFEVPGGVVVASDEVTLGCSADGSTPRSAIRTWTMTGDQPGIEEALNAQALALGWSSGEQGVTIYAKGAMLLSITFSDNDDGSRFGVEFVVSGDDYRGC